MMCKTECCCLSACSLGVAFGITKGLFVLVLGWVAAASGHGVSVVETASQIYSGYAPTFLGGIIGGIWGLVIGFIFGVIVGWIYNLTLKVCCRKCSSSSGDVGLSK